MHALQADEELLLLEAVDMYGPSNWKDVWRHVGTKSEARSLAAYAACSNSPSACEEAVFVAQVHVHQHIHVPAWGESAC